MVRIPCYSSRRHNQDELKQRILTQAQSISPDDYAFTRTVRTEQTSNGKTEKEVSVEKFDPTKPAEARWMLVSVNGAPPSADALEILQKTLPNDACPVIIALPVTSEHQPRLRPTPMAERCFILPLCRKKP